MPTKSAGDARRQSVSNYRHVICRTKDDGEIEWLIPSHRRESATKCIRRWYPHGLAIWYGIPDRDATEDDLVNPDGALAFGLGISVGLLEGAWSRKALHRGEEELQLVQNHTAIAEAAARTYAHRRMRRIPRRRPDGTRERNETSSDHLRCTEFSRINLLPATRPSAFDFRYSRAFLGEGGEIDNRLWRSLQRAFQIGASANEQKAFRFRHYCGQVASSLVLPAARPAYDCGRSLAQSLWADIRVIDRIRRSPDTYLECSGLVVKERPSERDKRLQQAIEAAIWFLEDLKSSDFITFSEALASPGGPAWDGQPAPTLTGPFEVPGGKAKSKGRGLDHEMLAFIRECAHKWPSKSGLIRRIHSEFPALHWLTENQINHTIWPRNRRPRKKLKARATRAKRGNAAR